MKKVLIVDDNPDNIGILFECLENAGFKTFAAQDGKDAIEMSENILPDIILLDVLMPEMNGFTTCKVLKNNDKTAYIPIIFMTALTDTENKLSGFSCGAVDYICKPFQQEEVIARINTHLTIQEQKNRLLKLNKEKEKMISIIAHDLRSPFNGILGMLSLLTDSFDSFTHEEKYDYISSVYSSARNVYTLVTELLNWAISETGQIEFMQREIKLNQIIKSAISVAKDTANEKNIEIEINIEDSIKVYADSNMLSAVIRNIVANSIKFTRTNGKVTISAKHNIDFIDILIKDTGIGMDKKTVERLITGDKTITTLGTFNESGTGLGLRISKDFIKKNNGKLKIDSTPGFGSQFTISIPSA